MHKEVVGQESKYGYWKNNRVFADGDIFGWVKRAMRYWHMFQLLCESHNPPTNNFKCYLYLKVG